MSILARRCHDRVNLKGNVVIWSVAMSVPVAEKMTALELDTPPRFQWMNASAIGQVREVNAAEHLDHEFWEEPSLSFSVVPEPIVKIDDPDFDSDYLTRQIFEYASAKLRRAFNLNSSFIRYRGIDVTGSTPNIFALDYKMYDVTQYGNPFDPTRMVGAERDVRQPDGSTRREWVLDYFNRMKLSPDIYIRSDFQPTAPLFRATGSYWVFATDDFAEQVMRSGAKGIMFYDITGSGGTLEDRIRKMR